MTREATLRSIVHTSVLEADMDGATRDREWSDRLAWHLQVNLNAAGYAIHHTEGCVRVHPMGRNLGREMTPDEMAAYGVKP
jgi:hypothetical protein